VELILLRHAAPPASLHRRYLGHTDIGIDPDLFDAAKISPLLGIPYDRVYSSDLSRCTRTLEKMEITDFVTDPRLREVRFRKEIEGKTFEEIEATEEFDPRFLESMERWHGFVCEEPLAAFRERIRNFLDTLPQNGELLVCAHAGTIREILSQLSPGCEPITPGYLEYTIVRVK
jgi:alpha-ribazole phosphatase/probable phosphoglycerate mutase